MNKRRAMDLIYGSDLHATRFLLGFAELCWAIALLWPGDTFGRPTYNQMSYVAPEECWAVIFLVTGLLQFRILFVGSYSSTLAKAFAGWNAALWIYVTLSMYMSVYPPPAAISGELSMALGASWIFMRAIAGCLFASERRTAGMRHA